MSMSDCQFCGGHIDLGPDATNRCTKCGKHYFDAVDPVASALMNNFQSFIMLCDSLGYKVEYKILKISKKDPTP